MRVVILINFTEFINFEFLLILYIYGKNYHDDKLLRKNDRLKNHVKLEIEKQENQRTIYEMQFNVDKTTKWKMKENTNNINKKFIIITTRRQKTVHLGKKEFVNNKSKSWPTNWKQQLLGDDQKKKKSIN